MNTLIFLLIVGGLFGVVLLVKSAYGQGLVADARHWWKLRSIQIAAAVALVPQFLGEWIEFIGSLWPDAQMLFLQILPGAAQDSLTVAGALFALYRLAAQKGLPRWPSNAGPADY